MGTEAVFGVPEFVALSGMKVRKGENGHVKVGLANGYLDRDAVFAVEEWAQAKRDAELGRWRSKLNPSYVVYPIVGGVWDVRVVDETAGVGGFFNRDGSLAYTAGAVAAEYFEAHPESKPWHDAAQGEFWSVHHMGMVEVCQVLGGRFVGVDNTVGSRVSMPITHHSITAAHRLVEEVAS